MAIILPPEKFRGDSGPETLLPKISTTDISRRLEPERRVDSLADRPRDVWEVRADGNAALDRELCAGANRIRAGLPSQLGAAARAICRSSSRPAIRWCSI